MRPLLAVDVDGVIVLFGGSEHPSQEAARFELIDGMMHCIPHLAGQRLQALAEHYDLVWASGWEARANEHLPRVLGLPQLPYLSFGGSARFGSADWKLGPLEELGRGRALAWIDDSFDKSCHAWAEARPEPTLLVPTLGHLGLEASHVETLVAWVGELGV